MKLLKKVKGLEVKRCFVLSNRFTSKRMRKDALKKQITKPTKETFSKNIAINKRAVLKLKETALDLIISTEYKKRLKAYDSVDWHIGFVDLSEVGLWKGAGGLPKAWTYGSLRDSANEMSHELKKNDSKLSRIRAMKVVLEIINSRTIIKKEKYLLPIILPGGTITTCRKGMRKMKGDIDDGCMRSLAFAINGDKQIRAYIGTKREKNI
ncbi:MAG: hypothetical protein WAV73_01865 [Candidatus Moraniibacteriota bacterium]